MMIRIGKLYSYTTGGRRSRSSHRGILTSLSQNHTNESTATAMKEPFFWNGFCERSQQTTQHFLRTRSSVVFPLSSSSSSLVVTADKRVHDSQLHDFYKKNHFHSTSSPLLDKSKKHSKQQQQGRSVPTSSSSSSQHRTSKEIPSRNNKDNNKNKKEAMIKFINLSQCTAVMENLLQQRERFTKAPSNWLFPSSTNNDNDTKESIQQRYQLFLDTKTLASAMSQSIQQQQIIASSGKDIYELSALLGNFLFLYSESPPSRLLREYKNIKLSSSSPYQASLEIMEIVKNLNLDVQPNHYASVIRSACQDHQWDDAANYFLNQINPDASGWVPMDPTLGWNQPVQMGLYAVAKMAQNQQQHKTAVHLVFNAVFDMCMISPTDQEKYVLAAGAALGRAGLWKECIQYVMNNNEIRTKLGRPLIAAAMLTCVESKQYDAAIQFHDTMSKDPLLMAGSEWQWGGDYNDSSTTIHPLCRDLLLQAVGSLEMEHDYTSYYNSDFVWKLMDQIIHEEAAISTKSLLGAFQTFERDFAWEKSVQLLQRIILVQRDPQTCLLILKDDDSYMNFLVSNNNKYIQEFRSNTSQQNSNVGKMNAPIVASMMKACNQSEFYGLAILCYHLVSLTNKTNSELLELVPDNYTDHLDYFLSDGSFLLQDKECFVAFIDSLRGLRCNEDAAAIQSRVETILSANHLSPNFESQNNPIIGTKENGLSEINSIDVRKWHEHVYKISILIEILRRNNMCEFTAERQKKLLKNIAEMMTCSCDLGHPFTALITAQLAAVAMQSAMKTPASKNSTVQGLLQSLLNIPTKSPTTNIETMEHNLLKAPIFSSDDQILSATMNVMSLTGNQDDALDLYFSKIEDLEVKLSKNDSHMASLDVEEQNNWIRSKRMAFEVFLRNNQLNDAMDFFENMSDLERDPKCYLSLARALCDEERWDDLQKIYYKAQENGCMSESLGLVVMGGLSKPQIKNKIKVLRSISEYIASISGMTSDEWIRSRYWELKGIVGYHYARLLIWVKDPAQTQEKELELALSEVKDSKAKGLAVGKDALRCIVRVAGHDQRSDESKSVPAPEAIGADEREKQQKERSKAIDLIKTAYTEANKTILGLDPNFIEEVASGLCAMKANYDCIEVVRKAILGGVQIKPKTMEIAFAAAEAENDAELTKDTFQFLSQAGFSLSDDEPSNNVDHRSPVI